MKAITIDNFDIKAHERYAQDQQKLEPKYITESNSVPSYSEIAGTSAIYSSKWEELFEIQLANLPWAMFSAPPKFSMQPNKFFTYRILPKIIVEEEKSIENEDESEEGKEEKKRQSVELLNRVLTASKEKNQNSHAFEKDKTTILNLLESVRYLDKLLGQINSKKLQYQKG